MARFRKRMKIFPGIFINFSKSGISFSFGTKGLSYSVGKRGQYLNAGIPGSGLYNRFRVDTPNRGSSPLSDEEVINQYDENDSAFIEIINLFLKHETLTLVDIKQKLFLGSNRARRQIEKGIERGFLIGNIDGNLCLKPRNEIATLLSEYGIKY